MAKIDGRKTPISIFLSIPRPTSRSKTTHPYASNVQGQNIQLDLRHNHPSRRGLSFCVIHQRSKYYSASGIRKYTAFYPLTFKLSKIL